MFVRNTPRRYRPKHNITSTNRTGPTPTEPESGALVVYRGERGCLSNSFGTVEQSCVSMASTSVHRRPLGFPLRKSPRWSTARVPPLSSAPEVTPLRLSAKLKENRKYRKKEGMRNSGQSDEKRRERFKFQVKTRKEAKWSQK